MDKQVYLVVLYNHNNEVWDFIRKQRDFFEYRYWALKGRKLTVSLDLVEYTTYTFLSPTQVLSGELGGMCLDGIITLGKDTSFTTEVLQQTLSRVRLPLKQPTIWQKIKKAFTPRKKFYIEE